MMELAERHTARQTEDRGSPAARSNLAGIVVTDLVGSTALRVRLGEEAADEVWRRHQKLLEGVVARHCGQIVRWLGDGALAVCPSASGAMRTAIGIQQAIERENRRARAEAEVAARVGVSAGEVLVAESECRGPAIDEATGLCGAAAGGEILATPLALDLAGSRADVRTRAAAAALALDWQPLRSSARRLGLPAALQANAALPLVGRDDAWAELAAALEAVLGGEPRLVILVGEAGIGKTRLAVELGRAAFARGAAVLYGSVPEHVALPYDPIPRLLRDWVDRVDDLVMRLGARAGELIRLLPELSETVPDLPPPTRSDAETARLRLFDAVGEWMSSLALDDPIAVLLDSLHWAGNTTFDLLRHLLPMLCDRPALLVTTHRPSDDRVGRLRRWGEEVLGAGRVTCLELDGLTGDAVAELVRTVSESPAEPALVSALHAVTAGNPLHLGELLRESGRRRAHPDLPQSVRAAVRANLDKLDRRDRRAVEAAAVLGSEFDAPVLADMLADPDGTYDALDVATQVGLLREVDRRTLRYAFVHDLTWETAYHAIGAARLARLHERAGLTLERLETRATDARLADLARHFAAAVALGHRDRAVRYAARAAQRALDQYANEQAAQLFAGALALLGAEGDAGVRVDLSIGRGEALRRVGDPTYREVLLGAAARARQIGDGARMGRALLATYRGTFSRAFRVDMEKVEQLRTALRLIGAEDRPVRARLLALLAVELVWADDRRESTASSDQAVAVARRLADPVILAEVLAQRQWAVFHPIEARLATTDELRGLAAASGDPQLRFEAASSEVFTAMRAGDRAQLDRAMAAARALADESRQPMVRWMLLIREAAVALMEGRFAAAAQHIDEGHALALWTGQPDVQAQRSVQRFWLEVDTEPPAQARIAVGAAARGFRQAPPLIAWPPILFRCCDLGLDELAAPILAAIAARGLSAIPVDQIWLWSLCQIAAAAAALRHREIGAPLRDLLAPHAAQHANMVFATLGSVARYVGLLEQLLGRFEPAEHCFESAARANAAMGAVTWLARSRLDLAALRFERYGRSDAGAAQALAAAAATASELGLPTVAEQAARLRR